MQYFSAQAAFSIFPRQQNWLERANMTPLGGFLWGVGLPHFFKEDLGVSSLHGLVTFRFYNLVRSKVTNRNIYKLHPITTIRISTLRCFLRRVRCHRHLLAEGNWHMKAAGIVRLIMKRFLDEKTDWPGGQPEFNVDNSIMSFCAVALDERRISQIA